MKNNAIKVRERLRGANHSPRCVPKAVIQEQVCVGVAWNTHEKVSELTEIHSLPLTAQLIR